MGLLLIAPPAIVPVSMAELRQQVNLAADDTTHDADLSRFASAAAEYVERTTRRAMINQQFRFTTSWRDVVELPRPPLVSIESITLHDRSGGSTLIESGYEVLADRFPGVLVLSGVSTGDLRDTEPLVVEYTAGYGDEAGDVPANMRLAVAQLAAFYFEIGRGDFECDVPQHIKDSLKAMSSGTRVGYFRGVI